MSDHDLIYRQEAIDALAKWFFEVFGIRESDGTATIFKRLREIPSAQPEQRWIPVSERPPEKNGEYLVTRQGRNIYAYLDLVEKGPCSGDIASDIVAWMPAPEPYKEGE